MSDKIARRDFLNGMLIAASGVAIPGWAASANPAGKARGVTPAPYPPSLTGLRGSHAGSFETAHQLRDGARFDSAAVPVSDRVDLAVVGAGISGLSAAHFYRQKVPRARVLLFDTNDDFGGHAKRNEFWVDGRLLVGYGGTQSIDGPKHKWSPVARQLLKDVNIDVQRLGAAFDQSFYQRWNLHQATLFKKEVFGVDRLVIRRFGGWQDYNEPDADEQTMRQYVAQMPLSEAARAQLLTLYLSNRDVLKDQTPAQRQATLDHMSYRDFLKQYWNADDEVLKFFQTRTHSLWAVGIDAIPASFTLDLPGLQAQRRHVTGEGNEPEEPYIYHFPDGNASIARLLVRKLVPASAPGSTMEDIVLAPFDYSQLDRPDHDVRVRLSATVVHLQNTADGVEVTYQKGTELTKILATHCVSGCYEAMVPYLSSEIGADQAAALHANVRAPLVYVNVALRNWKAWHQLGIASVVNPGGSFEASLDYPVSLGNYRFSADPSQPILAHLEFTPTEPNRGLDMRAQYRAGRTRLYTTSFADYEKEIRDELSRMLGAGGFEFDRDVAGLTVNRWPHGYAYTPTPLFDDPQTQADRQANARRIVGRIAIANSDAGWDAYTHVAIAEAHRAVGELLRS